MSLLSFRRAFGSARRAPASVPEGLRIYAIGDVHGRLDLLETLASLIAADLEDAPQAAMTVFLGDYVDRGTDFGRGAQQLGLSRFSNGVRRSAGKS